MYEKGISVNVCSKAYGLPGLRIGWIACRDTGLLHELTRFKQYLSICNSAPSERLALIALKNRDAILTRNRRIVSANIELLDSFFGDYPDLFDWVVSDGGCIAYPRFKGSVGVERFCDSLIEEAGILLIPSSVFRSELLEAPTGHFRIGFGRSNLGEGLDAFRGFLDQKNYQPM